MVPLVLITLMFVHVLIFNYLLHAIQTGEASRLTAEPCLSVGRLHRGGNEIFWMHSWIVKESGDSLYIFKYSQCFMCVFVCVELIQ